MASENMNTNSTQSASTASTTNNSATTADNNQTSVTNLENAVSSNIASATNATVGPEEEAAKCQVSCFIKRIIYNGVSLKVYEYWFMKKNCQI